MTVNKINVSKLMPVMMIYIIMGFADIIGVATAYVQKDFELTDSLAQLLPSMALIWFFLLSVPTGVLLDKHGKKKLVSIGVVTIASGMLLPFVYYSFYSMMLSIALMGVGNTIIQVSTNPLLLDVVPSKKFSSFMSFSQFIKAISSLLGPVIAAFAASAFGDWKYVFLVYGITSILSVLWLNFTKIEETKPKELPATFGSCFGLLGNKFILFMTLGIFFVVGADVGMNTNITTYLHSLFNLSVEDASLGISLYFTALMIGRFLGAILLNYVESSRFLILSTLFAMLGIALMMFTSDLLIARVAIFIIGLSSANLFPLIFSIALEKMPDRANEISGLMVMAISGGAFIPPVIGVLSTNFGIRTSLVVLIACMVYILFAGFYSLMQTKKAA